MAASWGSVFTGNPGISFESLMDLEVSDFILAVDHVQEARNETLQAWRRVFRSLARRP